MRWITGSRSKEVMNGQAVSPSIADAMPVGKRRLSKLEHREWQTYGRTCRELRAQRRKRRERGICLAQPCFLDNFAFSRRLTKILRDLHGKVLFCFGQSCE